MPIRDLRSLSTWMKIALICISLGVLLFIIGFATNSWMVSSDHYRVRTAMGLWRQSSCNAHTCNSAAYQSRFLPDFHKATQAMECIGLIGLLLAFLLLLLYICVDSCRRREAMLATIFFIFGGVVCMVIGYIVFATKYEERHGLEIGWSMGVAMAGTICTFIAGVFCVLHIMAR